MSGTQPSRVTNAGTIGGGVAAVQFQNVNGNYSELFSGRGNEWRRETRHREG